MTTPAEQLSDLLASGLFSDDDAVRKHARTALAAHTDPAVAAFFATDKRTYQTVHDGAKLVKVAKEFVGLGADGPRFAVGLIKAWHARSMRPSYQLEGLLRVPLAYPGAEPEAFEVLADIKEVHLPDAKKTLPPGLSRLRALEHLRIPGGTLTRADNIAELALIPQPFAMELWVKNADLTLWDAASQNIRGLILRGPFSAVSDASPLRGWKNLSILNLESTGVTDLSPLVGLPLEMLFVNETQVSDLSPLAAWSGLKALGLRRVPAKDFSVIAGLTALERLDLGFTAVRDLGVLKNLSRLRVLELWGTPVHSLEPLVGLPIEQLDLNYTERPDLSPLIRVPTLNSLHMMNCRDDAPGFAALVAARPDLYIRR